MKIVAMSLGSRLEAVETDQRGRAAVDQEAAFRGLDMIAGLQPAAGTEGIAAADDRELHGFRFFRICVTTRGTSALYALALGRAETSSCHRARFLSPSGRCIRAGFMNRPPPAP